MAEDLLKHICEGKYEVYSVSTKPSLVRPEAIVVLHEIGIDISANRSKSVDEFNGAEIDYVLTVCANAKENCPFFPAKTKLIHHSFDDPAIIRSNESERLAEFRRVREEILKFLADFLKNENVYLP